MPAEAAGCAPWRSGCCLHGVGRPHNRKTEVRSFRRQTAAIAGAVSLRSETAHSDHADKDATHDKSPAETHGPRPAQSALRSLGQG